MTRLFRHRKENLIYLVFWLVLFIAPVISSYVRASGNADFSVSWQEILHIWRIYAVFLVIFIVHDMVLAPLLVYRHRRGLYFLTTACLLAAFIVINCVSKPKMPRHHRPRPLDGVTTERKRMSNDAPFFPPDARQRNGKKEPDFRMPPPLEPPFVRQGDIVNVIFLALLLGMNIAVKLFFKSDSDQQQLQALERKNLEQQLEYLRYQVNPHFLMNTLNNIHALVDIDPEKSKQTILELSKMMRFVLYEGNKQVVPLDREIAFLQNYIQLMKLRYTDKVKITVDVPKNLPNKEVPPLMFITFVENAFKHGVSYRQASFIDIAISIGEDKLVFDCRNSRIPKEDDKHGGVGLANVKKRLELIYGNRYTLDIKDEQDTYTVKLSLPL